MKVAWLVLGVLFVVLVSQTEAEEKPTSEKIGRFLSLPNPQKCATRPKQFAFKGHNYFFSGHVPDWDNKTVDWLDGRNLCREYCMDLVSLETQDENNLIFKFIQQRPKQFAFKGHNYFFSGHVPDWDNKTVDWLDGRNLCREYCMDLVSLETQDENNLIFKFIQQNDVPYIWTSGRLCDFKGCENRKDLEPKNILGWFWSANREKIPPTNQIAPEWKYNAWSQTGHKNQSQPDNAEFDINGTTESCLAILNNVYNDGITWHDIGCYHPKPVICEDSDELIEYVTSTNPELKL